MKKSALGLTIVLSALLSLSGCSVIRTTGPCLGFGCPPLSNGSANAVNAKPTANNSTVAAKNSSSPDSAATPRKSLWGKLRAIF